MISHHLCCTLFVREKSWVSHTQEKATIQKCECQDVGIMVAILKVRLPLSFLLPHPIFLTISPYTTPCVVDGYIDHGHIKANLLYDVAFLLTMIL